ncbi:hypothetical protein Tsubulata_036167 [Turnera subulata]|uniref:Uncharacterized protein n=1 Tax=Turnera subulata TaxID=218843 RepID=A0A9Q0F614_9ROSI|nr:hypothetical protein Tsubulata_036167 [Turnera subulata]
MFLFVFQLNLILWGESPVVIHVCGGLLFVFDLNSIVVGECLLCHFHFKKNNNWMAQVWSHLWQLSRWSTMYLDSLD